MTERLPRAHLFRALVDGLAYRKLATSRRRLLTLAFLPENREHAFHYMTSVQPAVDRFKAYDR
jgi:hypothetical protein